MQDLFIHLQVNSDYSLGNSSIKIELLVKHCVKHNIPAVALTDQMNLFGAIEFTQKCLDYGIQPISGAILNIASNSNAEANKFKSKFNYVTSAVQNQITILAKNKEGYKNLMRLVSYPHIYDTSNHLPKEIPLSEIFNKNIGNIVLIGEDSFFGYLISSYRIEEAENFILKFQQHFKEDLFIKLTRCGNLGSKIFEKEALRIAYKYGIALVATNLVHYLTQEDQEAHDALLCISNGRYIGEVDRIKSFNDTYFKTSKEMHSLFVDLPEAIENTVLIAKKCSYIIETANPMLPTFDCEFDEFTTLKQTAEIGLDNYLKRNVFAHLNEKIYRKRLQYELDVINSMNFPGYFLIVSDFIKWSKKNNIPVGPGRGSGAGSLVALALDITTIDPLRFGLLFERFLNPDRISMPDFDIDFCQIRRDEVIDYVSNKYGISHVSHIVTFGKLQARAVLRDVGRILQMPYSMVDEISKMIPHNPANPIMLSQAIDIDKEMQYLRDTNPDIARLLRISLQLEGVSRHISTHAAGILIADRDIIEIAPLYKDQNAALPAVQYSMKYAEAVGLIKFDFLGLKTLTVIQKAKELIKTQHDVELDLNSIPLDDKSTYIMLSKGDTIGVFQFEGYGMRESIKNLKPDRFEDLVALASLYRPGPMDNIPLYIQRKHGLEKVEYIHPKLVQILKETYGIIVYQEQVMQIAQILAGYTLAEADLLRRVMGKKQKEEMYKQRDIFVKRAVELGTSYEQSNYIFHLIEKFASYGFNKSHAVAYAMISYQTAYIKAHYTAEFLVASINLEIDDTDKIHTFFREAKKFGINILHPSINKSYVYFSIESNTFSNKKTQPHIKNINKSIRFGLLGIKSIGLKIIQKIVDERSNKGNYQSILDFVLRTARLGLTKRMLEVLIKAGAFAEIHSNISQILQNVDTLLQYARSIESNSTLHQGASRQHSLFNQHTSENAMQFDIPSTSAQELPLIEKLRMEYEALGFHISAHPISVYSVALQKKNITYMSDIEKIATDRIKNINIAGLIISKKIRSGKLGKFAFLQLSDDSCVIDASIFSEVLLCKSGKLLKEGNLVFCKANVAKDQRGLRIVLEDMTDIEAIIKKKYSIYVYNDDKDAFYKMRNILLDDKNIHYDLDEAHKDIRKLIPLSTIKIIFISPQKGNVYCSINHKNNGQLHENILLQTIANIPNIEVIQEFE